MGSRINKIVGYGGFHPNNDAVFDHFENEKVGEVRAIMEDYQKKNPMLITELRDDWLYNHIALNSHDYPAYFHQVVKYADNYDSKTGIWVIMHPAFAKEWYRKDDPIDYVENTLKGEPSVPGRIKLQSPIYPFSLWRNKNTHESVKDYNSVENDPDIIPDIPISVRLIAEHLGFSWQNLSPVFAKWWD